MENRVEEFSEIQRALGRVEGKLDAMLATVTAHIEENRMRFDEHDKRINKAQKTTDELKTEAGLLGALAGIGVTIGAYIWNSLK